MKRYTDKFIHQVKETRIREKLSFKELSVKFNVSGGSIGDWCRGTLGSKTDCLLRNNERRRNQLKNSEIDSVPDIEKITVNQAKFYTGLLYGCEGSKYPAQKGIAFANSDPKLIVSFLELLIKGFDCDRNKFHVHLQIHSSHNYVKLRRKWSRLLRIHESRFIKPTITVPTGKKHRNNYIGTCTLRYGDYRIQLKILGIFEKFINKFTPEIE